MINRSDSTDKDKKDIEESLNSKNGDATSNDFVFTSRNGKPYKKPLTLENVLSLPDYEEDWVVSSLVLRSGITTVSGLPNHFKSFFVQQIACDVASGKTFLDKFKVKQGNVLIIDREIPTIRLKNRWKKLSAAQANIFFYNYDDPFKLDDEEDLEYLHYLVDEYSIDLLIIDTLNRSHSGKDISSARDSSAILNPLKDLISKTSVIIIHHSGKKGYLKKVPTPEELLGSVDLIAQTDVLITLRKIEETRFSVHHLKSRDGPILKPFVVSFALTSDDQVAFKVEGELKIPLSPRQEKEKIILDYLKRGKTKKQELVRHCSKQGIPQGTVENILTQLRKINKVRSETIRKKAWYFLPHNLHVKQKHLPTSQDLGDGKQGNIVDEAKEIFGVDKNEK